MSATRETPTFRLYATTSSNVMFAVERTAGPCESPVSPIRRERSVSPELTRIDARIHDADPSPVMVTFAGTVTVPAS